MKNDHASAYVDLRAQSSLSFVLDPHRLVYNSIDEYTY